MAPQKIVDHHALQPPSVLVTTRVTRGCAVDHCMLLHLSYITAVVALYTEVLYIR